MDTKNKNIILSIIVIFVGLLVAGGTYAFLTFSLNVTNGEYATGTECFNIEYNVNNGDGTQDITGTMFPSSGPSKGLNGKVSINVNSSCTMSGIGTLKLHVNDGTSSALSTKAAPRCVSHFTGLDISEYTTESACTEANEVWKYPDSYCEKADTLEVMKEYTTESTCTSNGGVWTTNGSPLKYAVYDSAGTSGSLLSSGHFDSGFVGTDVTLYDNFSVGTTVKNYYIYLWLDGNLTDNSFTELPFDGYISASAQHVNLPSEYQRVEYIESTGTQYIDTEIKPTATTDIEVTYMNGSSNISWQRVFGQSNSAGNSRFQIQMNNLNASNWYFNIAGVSKTFTLNTTSGFQTFKFESGIGIYLNGVLSQSFNNTETNNYSIWLFRGYDRYSSLKISRAKLWQSSTLVRDFIPCYKKVGSVPGFYDLINGKFYENNGTGTFEIGPSV